MHLWKSLSTKVFPLLIATSLPLPLVAQTVTPEKWGITASCLYEAAVIRDAPITYCAKSKNENERIYIVREREGFKLPQPQYRFTRLADNDSQENSDLPEQISITIPTFEKLRGGKYFAPLEIMVNTGGSGWFSSISFAVFTPIK